MAVQPDQVHLALPRDQGDLVLRVGLRRERAARQEVLRAADRLGDGAGRGLAGRAHAHPQDHPAVRREPGTSRRRSRPRAARPTWPCWPPPFPAGRSRPSATTSPGCGSGRTAAVRDQPRGRVLRRRAGHRRQDQRQRGRDLHGQQHLHQRGADRRRRRVVGGPDRRAARAPDRLEGPGLDARTRPSPPRTRTPGSPPRPASARSSRRSGTTRRACRSRRSCSAAGGRARCRW